MRSTHCACLQPPRIRRLLVPKGRAGTLASAGLIARLICDGAKDFVVRQTAIRIFRACGVPAKDRLGEVRALFEFVRRHVRYTRDIYRVELLHTARRMLQLRAGDCDDMTILLGAMLKATGHPVRLILAGFRRHRPHAYSHIYLEAKVGPRWIALDATMPHPMGWAPPAIWKSVCDLEEEGLRCSSRTA
jgi:transglutaminase-like putative cysteine protease